MYCSLYCIRTPSSLFCLFKESGEKPGITFLLLCMSFCLYLCKLHSWQFNASVFSNGYCKPQNLTLHCLAAGSITHISCYTCCSAFCTLLHHMKHQRLIYILIILTLQLNRTLSSLGEISHMQPFFNAGDIICVFDIWFVRKWMVGSFCALSTVFLSVNQW